MRYFWLLAAIGVMGCEGSIKEPAPRRLAPTGIVPDPMDLTDPKKEFTALPVALATSGSRRLTRAEYAASIRAVLGNSAPVQADALPADGVPFDNFTRDQVPSQAFVDAAESQANDLAQWVVADPARSVAIVGCTPSGAGDAACFLSFVQSFGRRVLRRPLLPAETNRFAQFQTFSTEDNNFYVGVRYVVAALLFHTSFLYRVEEASGAGRVLNDSEYVTRLAYLLTGSSPDDTLLDAATGLAADPVRARTQAERLLSLPSAHAQLARFHAMWLGYDRFSTEGLYGSMRKETGALVERVVFENRDFLELLTSRETWLDSTLAAHYGLQAPIPGTGAWVDLADARRAGILGHASLLAASSNTNNTSPTRRGKFVRERLLCDKVPPPPPNVDVDQPPKGSSPRACKEQRYEEHRSRTECSGCHRLMDPIGFGLEHFNRLGQVRTHDDGLPDCVISGQGQLAGVAAFSGPAELGQLLRNSGKVEGCVTKTFLEYAIGRNLDSANPRDHAMREGLTQRFTGDGRRMKEMLLDLATSQAFRTRLDTEAP